MLEIDQSGWLQGVERCPSPNFNERPSEAAVDLLVIHNISLPAGVFGGSAVRELFCNQLDCDCHPDFDSLRELNVSAHLLIERSGNICQFVSFFNRAWHAGVSSFAGRDNCNDFSIGIELEGSDDLPYTQAQYQSLIMVTRCLQCYYPDITPERITGHSDIAPGRKTDPGPAFDWQYYKQQLAG